MPRTVPAGITALIGQEVTYAPIFLVKWELAGGTQYLSSGPAVSFGGGSYVANRVKSIPSFEPGLIDRKTKDFSKIEIELSNLADDGSSTFPFTALDASTVFEDAKLTIYAYSPDAADAVLVWWGFSGRPKFSGDSKTLTLSATFFWDSFDLELPYAMTHQNGFSPTEAAGQSNDGLDEDNVIPFVFGAGDLKIRPVIYDKRVDGQQLYVNFIVSGCNGQPFSAGDLVAANVNLFAVSQATSLEFLTGSSGQAAPANLTRFPDGAAHPNVAYACAVFQITNEIKDRIDQLGANDIKMLLSNGRPLLDTTIPSENAVLCIKDIMRDPNFGLGLPSTLFDATAITDAANYVGTRYQVRYEIKEKKSATERIQQMLADCHCFITFDNGLIQIRAKKNTESGSVTFRTVDSGGSARKIHQDFVNVSEKDFSELINQQSFNYRRKNRNKRRVTLYDPTAQSRAGGLTKKVVSNEIDEWEDGGLYDENQVKICSAIIIREEQNGDLFIEFSSPFWDAIDVAPGDVINVYSPDIFGANNTYRVIKQSIDTDGLCLVHFTCQVYKSAIYNDDAVALGVDLLRGGDSTDAQGRPPDVTPVSLTLIDVVTNDTEGKEATLRATWTYPTVDLAAEQADGIFREYPISELELWWHYTDEGFNQSRLGASVKYPTATADFHCQFFKSRSVECFFVAIGHNRARSPLGYVPDPTKVTSLTSNFAANPAVTANVVSSTVFTVNDYVQIEKEVLQLASKAAGTLTFVSSGGNRTPFFDSSVIAHPTGTEVAVAKKSYPSLTVALGRRFTYPIVTGLTAIPTGDGVRFRWADPSADNIETFYLYWSTDSDALSNAAKLGTATPTWYTTDPNSPPSGVNLSLNDDRAHKVTENESGGAVTVYARVAASNHRNFSSQLSASAQGKSGHGTVPDAGPPSAVQGLTLVWKEKVGYKVKYQRPTTNINTLLGYYVVYFNDSSGTVYMDAQTGQQAAVQTEAGARFFIEDTHHSTHLKASDLATPFSATGVKAKVYAVNLVDGVETDGTPTTTSPLVAPGSDTVGVADDTAAPSGLTAPTVRKLKRGGLKIDLVPPTGDALRLKRADVYIGNGAHGVATLWLSAADLTSSTATESVGAIAENPRGAVVIPVDKSHLEAVFGVGATISVYATWTNNVGTSAFSSAGTYSLASGEAVGSDAPGSIAFPTSLAVNTVDGDPEKNLARVAVNLTTSNAATFAANHIRETAIYVVQRNDANTADVGIAEMYGRTTLAGIFDGNTSTVTFYMQMGRRFRINGVVAINGDKENLNNSSVLDFMAGGIRGVDSGDTKTVPAPTFFAQPAADGNKHASFTIRIAQDGVDIVWFKHLVVEVSYGGGTYRQIEGSPIGLKSIDTLYTGVSASADFIYSCKRKPGVTLDVRATVRAVGGKASATTNATQLAASADDLAGDTAAPSTLATPTLEWSTRGGLVVRGMRATTNTTTENRYILVVYDGSTTYFDFTTNAAAASEAAARFDVGLKHHITIPIKKKKLTAVFGTSGSIKAYYYVENAQGTSSKSADSAALSLSTSGEFLSDLNDAVKVIDVSSLMGAPQNLVANGDWGYSTATSTTANVWRSWDKVTGITQAATSSITTTSTNLIWEQSNHRVKWISNAEALAQKVRSLVPGDYYNLTFMAKAVGSPGTPSISVKLVKASTATDEIEAATSISLSSLSTTDYTMYGAVFRFATTGDSSVAHWLVLQTASTLSGTNYIVLDRFMFARGKQPFAFILSDTTETGATGTSDYDITPASIGASPDVGNPTGGIQGGFFDSGSGGLFSVL